MSCSRFSEAIAAANGPSAVVSLRTHERELSWPGQRVLGEIAVTFVRKPRCEILPDRNLLELDLRLRIEVLRAMTFRLANVGAPIPIQP